MPKAKRIGSSGSGISSDIAAILGPPKKGASSSRSGKSSGGGRTRSRTTAERKIIEQVRNKPSNPLLSFMDVIDTPRAALVSLLNESGDALRGGDGDGFSVGDLFKQTSDNIGFNEYLDNQGVDVDALPGPLPGLVGFAGDVVLDPTTYLSGGATALGKQSAKEAAEELVQKAAQGAISREVAQEAIEALGKSGTASTLGRFPEAAKAVGWEGGLRAVAPGYGTVGRLTKMNKLLDRTAYGRAVGGGKGKMLIRAGDTGMAAAETLAKPLQFIRNRRSVEAVRRALSKSGNATNALFDTASTPVQRMAAAEDLARRGTERMAELRFAAKHQGEMKSILLDAKKLKLDDELWDALQSGSEAEVVQRFMATQGGAELLARARTWFNDLRNDINDIAGSEVIHEADSYAPGVLEHKFREQFSDVFQQHRVSGNGKIFAEQGRKLKPGTTLRGVDANGEAVEVTLVEPALAGGRHVRQQAEDFYKAVYGEGYTPMFNKNVGKVLPIYLDAMSRVAGREEGASFLRKTGAGKSLIDTVDGTPVADRIMARAADLDGDYDSVDLGTEAAAGRQVKNQTRLDALKQLVIDGADMDTKVSREYRVRLAADDMYRQADELDEQSVNLIENGDVQGSFDAYQQSQFRRINADEAVQKAKDIQRGEPNLGWGAHRITDEDLASLSDLINENVHQFVNPARYGANTIVEQDTLDMMTDFAKFNDPQQMRRFLRYYDNTSALLKRQQLTSPGFLVRNYMGGKFMHFIDGIDIGAERQYLNMKKAAETGDWSKLSAADKEAWEAWVDGPAGLGGQVAHEYDRDILDPLSVNPLNKNFAPYRAIGKGNDWVEDRLRGAHFTNAYKQALEKGASSEDAARSAFDRMVKYHFDYDDLTGFERNVIRRVIPFYTWSRKAIPQMLTDMARKPGKINNYFAAKENIEREVPMDQYTPQWMLEGGAWRLPTKAFGDGEGQDMWMPDLPINAIDKYVAGSPGDTLRDSVSQMSPLLKTPLEIWKGKQFFKDIPLDEDQVELPMPYSFLAPVLEKTPFAHRNAEGKIVMKGRHLYVMDQFMPLLGRARRLAPSEEKYQERIMASWLSFLGLGIRANTRSEQDKEVWRRFFAGKEALTKAQELGYAEGEELPYIDIEDPSTYPEWVGNNTVPDFRN